MSSRDFQCSVNYSADQARRLNLEVATRRELHHGPNGDVIVLEARNGRRIVSIPLTVEVVDPLFVAPETIFVRGAEISKEQQVTFVIGRTDGKVLGNRFHIRLPEGLSVHATVSP